ncbi:MAG TPA: hypothetical protein PKD91_08725, partial [Bacteroidia bacterium]|nr:hypothetical protein [Bacteroidia bacterium]
VLSSNINLYRSGLIILDQVTGNNRIFSNNNFNFNWNNLQTYWTYTECNSPPYAHKLFGSFSNCVLNSNSFTDLTPSTSPIPATNARFAFLAAIPSPNISDGLNTFTVTPGFFSHFSRRTSSFTCGLSSSNF